VPQFLNGNLKLNYVVQGTGKPIVALHGGLASHKVWHYQLESLSCNYEFAAIDLRGHGESAKPKWGYDLVSNVRDVELLMDNLGLQRAALMGSSMGGVIAQMFCLENPERVDALILVGTLARATWRGWNPGRLDKELMIPPEETVDRWFTERTNQEVINLAIQEARKVSPYFRPGVVRGFGNFDLGLRLNEISVPTLVIVGEKDRETPPLEAEYIHQNVKGSTLSVFPGCGHLVMLEKPDDFNRAVTDFLSTEKIRGHQQQS
jgi:pimeloyl-ACP methyl ester carboxylesterase